MKCYYKLFRKEGLINNIGFYIIDSIILLTIILCILFKIKGYNSLKSQIYIIINSKNGAPLKKKKGEKIKKEKIDLNKNLKKKKDVLISFAFFGKN